MKYVCIKPFSGLGCDIGDVIDIVREDGKYVIDGACGTDRDVVHEFFKEKTLEGWNFSPYSFSKMDSWASCPKKFQWNYIIKPPMVKVPNPILEKGTLFHAILEHDIVDKLDKFEIDDKFKALTDDDAGAIIEQALTFSAESKMYIDIKTEPGLKIPELVMYLDENLEPVENEEDALIRGFIDLVNFNEGLSSCRIHDWKTGGKSKSQLQKWPKPRDQLELYAIWASQVFGVKKIVTSFVYVEQDHEAEYSFTDKDIPALKKKFLAKINSIETDKTFDKNLTILCAWCDFRELCLGISAMRDPKSISKEEIFEAGRGKPRRNKSNSRNTALLNNIRKKAEVCS